MPVLLPAEGAACTADITSCSPQLATVPLVVIANVSAVLLLVIVVLLVQVEAAYDVLFMQSMKKRISGEAAVPTSVRFADVPTKKRSPSVSSGVSGSYHAAQPGGLLRTPRNSIATSADCRHTICP